MYLQRVAGISYLSSHLNTGATNFISKYFRKNNLWPQSTRSSFDVTKMGRDIKF